MARRKVTEAERAGAYVKLREMGYTKRAAFALSKFGDRRALPFVTVRRHNRTSKRGRVHTVVFHTRRGPKRVTFRGK